MPVLRLGLSKQRFDPDLPFAHRLLVRLGGVVAADPLQVGLVEAALHFEEAAVALQTITLPDAGQAGMVRNGSPRS